VKPDYFSYLPKKIGHTLGNTQEMTLRYYKDCKVWVRCLSPPPLMEFFLTGPICC